MNKVIENNQVTIAGEIISKFSYSNEALGKKFYLMNVKVKRLSEAVDIIPVMVSERLIDVTEDYKGRKVVINGSFRSYNRHEERKNKLVLSVFAREIEFVDEISNTVKTNQIFIDGYICKEPTYRVTPLGRQITDLLLATNRQFGKSDYIPCICWGRNARFVSNLEIGTHIKIVGRIQSREYQKKISDFTTETKTAYEVSVSTVEVLYEE